MSEKDTVRLWLTRLSLLAGIAYTASAEFRLAEALGAGALIAAMLPLGLDCYVVAAMRWGRWFDVTLSLSLMGSAQISAHALDAGVLTVDLRMVAVVSLLVPISIWRVHALARSKEPEVPSVVRREPAAAVPAERDRYSQLAEARVQREYGVPEAEVRAPETHPELEAGAPEDELTAAAREQFADVIEDGGTPGIRALRTAYSIGQPRAQRIRDELARGVRS